MSWIDLIPRMSRRSDVNAEMATGTSCKLWLRFSAVTTSSSMVLDDAATAAGLVWACAPTAAKAVASTSALEAKKRTLVCNFCLPIGHQSRVFENGDVFFVPLAQASRCVNLCAQLQPVFEHEVCKNTRITMIFAIRFKNT